MVRGDGSFAFTSYVAGDGLPEGRYVVVMARLKKEAGPHRWFDGPDGLKNLYNDPEVNARRPEFVIDHKSPGRRDYLFDLKIEGKPAVVKPSPNALTELKD